MLFIYVSFTFFNSSLIPSGKKYVAGVVKYVGKVAGREGTWAGVQLDKAGREHFNLIKEVGSTYN